MEISEATESRRAVVQSLLTAYIEIIGTLDVESLNKLEHFINDLFYEHQMKLNRVAGIRMPENEVAKMIFCRKNYDSGDFIKPMSEWINLREAVARKGGYALETCETHKFLQPCCGTNSRTFGKTRYWLSGQIFDWFRITDENLWEYSQKFNVNIPSKYNLQ